MTFPARWPRRARSARARRGRDRGSRKTHRAGGLPVSVRACSSGPPRRRTGPRIHPFYSAIVEAGETYAFPPGQSSEQAFPWWMEKPPGLTVVAVDGDDVLGSAKMGPTARTWSPRRDGVLHGRSSPPGARGRQVRRLLACSSTRSSRRIRLRSTCRRRSGSRSSERSPTPSTIGYTGSSGCT